MLKFGPLLAETFVMKIVGKQLHTFREKMKKEILEGKFNTLQLMHHFTSGLKSLYSQMAYDGVELVRTNCGGAGYSVWSNLPEIFFTWSPNPIMEGDNTVMA